MYRITCSFLFLIGFVFTVNAQDKKLSLEEIWDGSFSQERLESLQPMANGTEYAVQNYNRTTRDVSVDIYSYKTGEKTKTLISAKEIPGLNYFQTYEFSQDQQKALLSAELEQIYRRSSKGVFYVYDIVKKQLQQVNDKAIQEPDFSPDATKIAYVYENNLYVKNLINNQVIQVTQDGKKNEIINGISDWVYEEEFSVVQAYQWNADGTKIAFLKFDETQVPVFSMDMYGTYPNQLYPTQDVFKYPKAGEQNAKVSLHVYDLEKQSLTQVNLQKKYEYIPVITWTQDANLLSVQAMNRHQNKLDFILVDTKKNTTKTILSETDKAYVDLNDQLNFLADNSFIWASERDGWNHLYHYNIKGKLLKQITTGNWEVTDYYGYNANNKTIYYQSTENGSINRGVYAIKINGKNKRALAAKAGTNYADFSADYTYYINSFSNAETLWQYKLYKTKTLEEVRVIEDNAAMKEKIAAYNFSSKEFSTMTINGNDLNMWMIKPKDFDASKKYPLLMYQYSGPGSQSVSNTSSNSNDYWYQYLADKGYIIVCVDGRGTGQKGADFKKITQLELGKYEVEDQIAAAKKLGEQSYIDENRIGIWGWSYGGFMSSNCIFQGGDTFKLAIAVAPVTSWRFYDTIYTERYMTTPQENPSGYDDNSPITHVNKFNDNNHYLLIHGSADDNVHVQNTMQLIEALVQANKNFDWAIYPDKNHGIYGGNTRLHLYNKMTNYILKNL
ncbi:dipeptidyl-peptidase-4 [Mesonia hippocampi]|uniref:Dipeptidyl-peptidase-4 n=1 Tax=Mesonia hippocampi TaxID=1628250 RepID=A0A840EZD4_9FLAO|nr:S9 family peptidase [Mesonia hippocampi]MBB4119384.1 dipeptidyl-peptidase-4 [Mesonia hippocampi]